MGATGRVSGHDGRMFRTTLRTYRYLGRSFGDDDLGIDTSLVLYFGPRPARSRASAPPLARTSTPAALGDSDRDGVPDDEDECPGTPVTYAVDENGCPIGTDAGRARNRRTVTVILKTLQNYRPR